MKYFVEANEGVFIDPEKIVKIEILAWNAKPQRPDRELVKASDASNVWKWEAFLTLDNMTSRVSLGVCNSYDEAMGNVDELMEKIRRTKKEAESELNRFTPEYGHEPQLGDVYKILDHYWEVTHRVPEPRTHHSAYMEVMLPAGQKFEGMKVRQFSFDVLDQRFEFVGNRKELEKNARLVMKGVRSLWESLKPVVSEEHTPLIHYTTHDAPGMTACCGKTTDSVDPQDSFTGDQFLVTCSDGRDVVTHYGNADNVKNHTQCCGVSVMSLRPGVDQLSERANEVTCSSMPVPPAERAVSSEDEA